LARLVDALVHAALDKETFNERKRQLLDDQAATECLISAMPDIPSAALADMFELANSAQQSYRLGDSAAKRELALRLCSNRSVVGHDVVVEPHPLLRLIAKGHAIP
jgi:hypothetical protein